MSEVKSQVNRSDIQGLVAFGYVKLTLATYYLLRIRDADAARAWCLKSLPVATAEPAPQAPDTALQIGFTPRGLQAMGLSDQTIGAFSIEFNSGIAGDPSRSRRLGDIGASDPASWWWGTPDKLPDMIAMLFAKRDLDSWTRTVQDENWQRAFEVLYRLDTSNMGGNEPFGFHDGISQPAIDWKPEVSSTGDGADFSNISAAGEFVLGYQNEYGKYTGRPLIDPADDPERILPAAGDDPSKKDLGRNGTYLVVRQLEQDVSAFWKYLDGAAGGDAANRDRLGAAMVGRTRAGDPLAAESKCPIAGIKEQSGQPRNSFTFDADPDGTGCPFGAHIRRANPRNADLFGHPRWFLSRLAGRLAIPRPGLHDDLMASTRFHRILRRGREYGTLMTPEQAIAGGGDPAPRGLQFACLNANIGRQFEFVQGAWLMSPKFNGLRNESDPLLGNREMSPNYPDGGVFSMPAADGPNQVLQALPRFITVRGGAYFFMPGLAALRYIASKGART